MIVGFLIKVLATIAELIIPMLLAYVINDIVPQQDVKLILYWGGIMLLFSVLAFLGNVTANRMASKVARNATEQIRYDLFHKIMYLSSKQLEELTTIRGTCSYYVTRWNYAEFCIGCNINIGYGGIATYYDNYCIYDFKKRNSYVHKCAGSK